MIEKHTEKTVLKAVHNQFSNRHRYCIKNAYIFEKNWESDYFCVTKEGYSIEVEAKISKADFKNDFKKGKHKLFLENPKNKLIPNKFFYAVPEGLIDVKEIPDYAGLIVVSGYHSTIKKRAPFLNKVKFDYRKLLCDKFYYQWLNHIKKLHHVEYDLERANDKIERFCIFSFDAEKKTWVIKSIDYQNKKVVGESHPHWDKKTRTYTREEEIKEFEFKEVKFK